MRFDGRPVWQASASIQDRHSGARPVDWWNWKQRKAVERWLFTALRGVGTNESIMWERLDFTLQIRKFLTADECRHLSRMPDSFECAPAPRFGPFAVRVIDGV